MQKDNIQRPSKGLHLDSSYIDQPKDTYRFALNAVNETELGDFAFISNEESNEICADLPNDFVPIGKIYVSNNESILFLVTKDDSVSEIGILNDNCEYTTIVNDASSLPIDKLNFRMNHQIQGTYRLRRGCERTIYFTDDYNKPRYFNFDKPEDFQNVDTTWAGKKFNLFKEYNKIPIFEDIEVLDSGGTLEPGSYNIAIQYVDEGLNPTEWLTTSEIINIYNDPQSQSYLDIQGSINSDSDYINYPTTTKSIKVSLNNIDTNFAYYRLAFIEASNGVGEINKVSLTDILETSKNFFIFTGDNIVGLGTVEEIAFFNEIIYKAGSIEQIENRLLLGNTQGKQVDFCELQKYASRIKADCVTKKIILNDLNAEGNPKRPTIHFEGTGYMPGEIYSFGIVYIFQDGSLSPVYHIPGKNNTVNPTTVYAPGPNTYPMSINNTNLNTQYIDNNNCASGDYWAADSEGQSLNGEYVRHHRFPLRSELGILLVEEESLDSNTITYYQIRLTGTGTTDLPVECEPEDVGCVPVVIEPWVVQVTYTVDGVTQVMTVEIEPDELSNPVNLITLSTELYTSNVITIISIEEGQVDGSILDVTGITSPRGIDYTAVPIESAFTSDSKLYSTEILGIKFSGIDIPDTSDTNGEQIIGYYIVRNERVENEKTILDSAVLTPSVINSKYISHGLLNPEFANTAKISKNLFGMIHPEHKFNGKEYAEFDYIKQEGNFNKVDTKKSKTRFQDVYDGTSYQGSKHKSGESDDDGWSLKIIVRDIVTRFRTKTLFNVTRDRIKEIFYLKALESRDINDGANVAYNISSDNRIGMVQLEVDNEIDILANRLPYVIIGRNIADSYSNFRTLPYYKESINPETTDTTSIFNGDTYVSPMRYTNSVFWDNRICRRKAKKSLLTIILGAFLIVVGTVLLFFTAGASTLVIGAGIAVIGGGALFLAAGIEQDNWAKAYQEEYKKGLRQTALDDWVNREYMQMFDPSSGSVDTPADDEIQWIGDCISDLWFETTVNTTLRNKMTSDAPTFLDAPGIIETGNIDPESVWEFFGLYKWRDNTRLPISKVELHLNKKLLVYNSKRKDSREYIGLALGEYYQVNPDYNRKNKEKIYFHLPIEYDCCSDCKEDFPHRIYYSEQSFQEELTDNYRVFLPNNYRDIEGESGEITNLFKIGNNLFIHTREALWQLPRSYQERITDQVVSFIGTGSYFEIPPQKIVDDDTGSSAGSQHKWSTIKTPVGVFFVCENQAKIFQFDGKQLKPISSVGLSNWFKEHSRVQLDRQYYDSTNRLYPYRDNPSNLYGTGFISAYDTKKERVIFTKKDLILPDSIIGQTDFELCTQGGQLIIFENFQQTIEDELANGWEYVGIENCQMKFQKVTSEVITETREITTTISNNADIIVHLDTSGSFDAGARAQIKAAIDSWLLNFSTENPDWVGNLYYQEVPGPAGGDTERWIAALGFAKTDLYSGDLTGRDIILISFVNESDPDYHGVGFGSTIAAPTGSYLTDEANFRILHDECNSFVGLAYPLVFSGADATSEYLKHVLAAVKGTSYSLYDANELNPNPFYSNWNTMKNALIGANPYPNPGLEAYNWNVITDRGWSGSGDIITAVQFQIDMDAFLDGIKTTETVETEITVFNTEVKYIDGEVLEDFETLDNSWTLSYSLKQESWTSWHSYMPNFYVSVPERLYSWNQGSTTIWKHNAIGSYQTYYGTYFPHVLEYVSLSNPLVTRIWNHIKLITEAKKYNSTLKEYYDERFITFNKAVFYNSRQCSAVVDLIVKDTQANPEDYFMQQTVNQSSLCIIDRTERDWSINDFRDVRVNYSAPIWDSRLSALQANYYTDKVLNNPSMNVTKDWMQLESFTDKYLVVRLIFDNFADTKLITNYSVENEQQSFT